MDCKRSVISTKIYQNVVNHTDGPGNAKYKIDFNLVLCLFLIDQVTYLNLCCFKLLYFLCEHFKLNLFEMII